MRGMMYGVILWALVAGCGDDDSTDGMDPDPVWTLVTEGEAAALLSVWGSPEDGVWAVGGDDRSEDAEGPLVLHYDRTEWERLDTGERGIDLWWVFGFAGGPLYIGGSGGTILRYQEGDFTRMDTPGDGVVFGLWGAAPDDVWAVGGSVGGGGGAFVWRYDGDVWTEVTIPDDIATVWKVAGRSADDVWMSGTAGAILHWDGGELERDDVTEEGNPIDHNLFSIGVDDTRVITVGGSNFAEVYENDGGGWVPVSFSQDLPTSRGVAVNGGAAWAVGEFASIAHRDADGWTTMTPGVTTEDLHAAWIDLDRDEVWMVGGKFDQVPTAAGVLIHHGAEPPPSP